MNTEEWRPRAETVALIDAAREVLDEAAAGGYRFTLRRVYYALVVAGVIPNVERSYKNLCRVLDRARWAGMLPMDCFDDLGRVASIPQSWSKSRFACGDCC